jgi:hypothetical protein
LRTCPKGELEDERIVRGTHRGEQIVAAELNGEEHTRRRRHHCDAKRDLFVGRHALIYAGASLQNPELIQHKMTKRTMQV